ncbi:MAG: patatin-like phospholipase family protein [Oleispira sp.]|nr:patatin-like phospholipase family protein [Oleispira sp.]MBL4882586.1 patatin-like phospholipase family protein [Oleispira sp.]
MTVSNKSSAIELDFHIYAGAKALEHIRQHGLKSEDISMLLGASSGPKWLVLHGFDQYLLANLKNRQQPLDLLGTSAGAWRLACYAQQDSFAAHQRLTHAYVEQSYSKKPSGDEILASCRNMVNSMLGSDGAEEVLQHETSRLHLITTQCHGLAAKQHRFWQGLGFIIAALGNLISRKSLGLHFTRIVMHHPEQKPPLVCTQDLPSRYQTMEAGRVADTLLSTGCIPVLTKGVEDIAGKGLYQDGGITDYGFDLPFKPKQGFVLYPHFSHIPAPGWFDKSLKWRKPKQENYSHTILLVPKQKFVESLPYGKIPDRNDFVKLSDNERKDYWYEVVQRSQVFAKQLAQLQPQDWAAHAEPLPWG